MLDVNIAWTSFLLLIVVLSFELPKWSLLLILGISIIFAARLLKGDKDVGDD